MTIKTYRRHGLALVAAGLLLPALAGCSRSEPEEQPAAMTENDTGVIETKPEDVMPAMENQAAPVADMNAVEETLPPPPPERTVDQQMLDDASATGMTSRVTRGRASSDEAAPEEAPTNEQ